MIRIASLVFLLTLCSCTEPPTPDTKVILGATLVQKTKPPIDHSVVIVKGDKIAAVGTQQMVPIPPTSAKVEAYGKFLTATEDIEPGKQADLIVFSSDPRKGAPSVERRMVAGRWVQ